MSRNDDSNSETTAFQFATLLQTTSEAIIGVTAEGQINLWNLGAERLLGYKAEEIVGKGVSVLIPAHLAAEEGTLTRRLQYVNSIHEVETARVHKDGHQVDVSLTYSVVRDQARAVIGWIIVAGSLAEHKLHERAERSLS